MPERQIVRSRVELRAMRRSMFLFVLVAATVALVACTTPASGPAGTGAPVVTADAITLGFMPPTVGAVWEEESILAVDLMVDRGEKVRFAQDSVEKKRVEILEVKGDRVTRARITYVTKSLAQELAGKQDRKPSPIEGKTYTLEAGPPTLISTEAGPAPDAEAAAVSRAEKSFGEADSMSKLFAGKRFKKDEAFELPDDEVLDAMNRDSDEAFSRARMALTFRRMDGGNAVFDIQLAMVREGEDGYEMAVEFMGVVVIDPETGDPLITDVAGPLKVSGQANGAGTMKMLITRRN